MNTSAHTNGRKKKKKNSTTALTRSDLFNTNYDLFSVSPHTKKTHEFGEFGDTETVTKQLNEHTRLLMHEHCGGLRAAKNDNSNLIAA